VITIEVRGLPAPQGSKRHVGHGIMVESSKAVGPWREAVRAETQRALESILFAGRDLPPTGGPMAMTATFYLPRPKSHYRTGRNAHLLRESAPPFPAGRPDLDKLLRALLDGLTAGGVWQDDSQVVQLAAAKDYGEPGCILTIDRLEDS
jgi:Holliday junction resolvase RusA-like endonuclease